MDQASSTWAVGLAGPILLLWQWVCLVLVLVLVFRVNFSFVVDVCFLPKAVGDVGCVV